MPPPLPLLLLLGTLGCLPQLSGLAGHTQPGASGPGPGPGPGPSILVAAAPAVPTGSTATLHCSVRNLQGRQVSWVRSRDLQILSHAGIVFTSDGRVTVPRSGDNRNSDSGNSVHSDNRNSVNSESDSGNSFDINRGNGVYSDRGNSVNSDSDLGNSVDSDSDSGPDVSHHYLRISGVRATDAGRYECQINTEPKMSRGVNLTILEHPPPRPSLPSPPLEGWVRAAPRVVSAPRGGEAVLSCEAGDWPATLQPVRWYRGDTLITPQDSSGPVLEWREWRGGGVSRLRLRGVRGEQGGPYRCGRGEASDTVLLRVDDIAGDEALAMQHAGSTAGAGPATAGLTAMAVLGLLTRWL